MGRLIKEQAVIDCLTNTAKYYEREDADEWTKGIHYGLLHGLDNILDNVPTVEAIPKDQYEARLKADMVAMLEKLKSEIILQVIDEPTENGTIAEMASFNSGIVGSYDIIQEKINALRGKENDDKNNT